MWPWVSTWDMLWLSTASFILLIMWWSWAEWARVPEAWLWQKMLGLIWLIPPSAQHTPSFWPGGDIMLNTAKKATQHLNSEIVWFSYPPNHHILAGAGGGVSWVCSWMALSHLSLAILYALMGVDWQDQIQTQKSQTHAFSTQQHAPNPKSWNVSWLLNNIFRPSDSPCVL